MSTLLSVSCVHCAETIVQDVTNLASSEIGQLRDHLLGCPAALAACAPALPLFERTPDVLAQFRVEDATPRERD